jgi:carbonic anhydrase/acetyltransferase-like protein (isoleucine patch superfamily)
MALVRNYLDFSPEMGENCWLAENATVIGNVKMGSDCSVWYNAVVRGDVHEIIMGNKVNVQDGAVVHCTYKKTGTYIGNSVSIGHKAIVHGCKIADFVLIGMGAIVMDLAEIGEGAIIAAGSVIKENTIVPPYTLWAGVPAKQVKELDKNATFEKLEKLANNYVMYASNY